LACDASYQGPYRREAKVEIGCRHGGFRSLHRSLRLGLLLDLVIELASGDRVRFSQWRVAVDVYFRKG
jgi:hypothetical protein